MIPAQTFTNHSFLLKREISGEFDERLLLFTYSKGKISVTARAVKKQGSRVRGTLQPLCLSKLTYIPSKSGNLRITGAEMVFNAFDLVNWPGLFMVAVSGFTFLNKFLPFNCPDQEIFGLTCNYLKIFSAISDSIKNPDFLSLRHKNSIKEEPFIHEAQMINLSFLLKSIMISGINEIGNIPVKDKPYFKFLIKNSFIDILENGRTLWPKSHQSHLCQLISVLLK